MRGRVESFQYFQVVLMLVCDWDKRSEGDRNGTSAVGEKGRGTNIELYLTREVREQWEHDNCGRNKSSQSESLY